MDWKPTYKVLSDVKPSDKRNFLCKVNGKIVDAVSLVHSKEVKKIARKGETIFTSADPAQNKQSARVNKETGRTLDRGIQLYRMWFNFLKLALELEELGVSIVRKKETYITNHNNWNEPIPKNIIDKSRRTEGGSKSGGMDSIAAIFRCKRIEKVKVKRSRYEGWDLDQVLTQPFNTWWKTHSHLFEGYLPSVMKSKDEWNDDSNFVYVKIDKTAQMTDIQNFMSEKLRDVIKTRVKPKFQIAGKNPRVNVLQNNFNALVLLIKGWTPKEICTHKNIYLRKTDERIDAKRTDGERLTVPYNKEGKFLYSTIVSKQKDMGMHHLFEVCQGRFGTVLNFRKSNKNHTKVF